MKATKNHLPKYKTNDNFELFPKQFEKIDTVSITVPNETYSLRDIVEKFSREYPKHLLKTGYYDGDEFDDFDDVDITRQPDFDLVDALELKGQIKEKNDKSKLKNTLLTDTKPKESDQDPNEPAKV